MFHRNWFIAEQAAAEQNPEERSSNVGQERHKDGVTHIRPDGRDERCVEQQIHKKDGTGKQKHSSGLLVAMKAAGNEPPADCADNERKPGYKPQRVEPEPEEAVVVWLPRQALWRHRPFLH